METNINLDRLERENDFDFSYLYEHFVSDSEQTESTISNKCSYYVPSDFRNAISAHGENFSVFSLNCRSLPAHWHEIKDLIACMSSSEFSFDIIGFSEIFRPKSGIAYSLEGYHELLTNIREETDDGRGGVGIFIKDKYTFNIRTDLSVFLPHVLESLFVELVIPKRKNIIIGCLYRQNTPPLADVDTFVQNILHIIAYYIIKGLDFLLSVC